MHHGSVHKLERTLFEPEKNKLTVEKAKKPEQVKALLVTGFECTYRKDNLIFFRKRK